MEKYPWYEVVDGDEHLEQGDFFYLCPVIIPSTVEGEEGKRVSADVEEYDVIVMTQSCDLVHGKINLVLVCPFWPLNEFAQTNDFYKNKKGREALRRGYAPGYHLLNQCELKNFETDYLVVDFRNVYSVPFDFLINNAREKPQRLRLLPPYKEHLSQAFARFFMRVGLPVDIPSFK